MAHLLEAVRLRGSIMNGDTGRNKQQHKEDKRHCLLTYQSKSDYIRQLVRHANGLQSVLRRNQAAGARSSADCATVSGSHDEDRDSYMAGSDAESMAATRPTTSAAPWRWTAADVDTSCEYFAARRARATLARARSR